jgi:hypothetical protein
VHGGDAVDMRRVRVGGYRAVSPSWSVFVYAERAGGMLSGVEWSGVECVCLFVVCIIIGGGCAYIMLDVWRCEV